MKEPVRLLSDLHLAHPVSRIERVSALRPLLEGVGTVIFNGDTWQELTRSLAARSAEMLAELRSLCAEVGCQPVFLSGNHDPGWEVPGWVELAGGRIVVTHGDALLFDGSPWKREILTQRERVVELWRNYPNAGAEVTERLRLAREIARVMPSLTPPGGKRLWQRAWDAATPPQRAINMLQTWWSQGQLAANFCDRYFPNAEVLVIGHFHWHGCWLRSGRRIINTGSFVNPGQAHWVDWHDGWLRRGVIDESPDACRVGKVLDIWRL
jgi:predicted phosphodiesterase